MTAAAASLTLTNVATTHAPAGADPTSSRPYIGVGSDTIQDIFDAFSGAAPYVNPSPSGGITVNFYTPISSSKATGNRTVSSWDAVDSAGNPRCITPKVGAPQIDGPNGSAQGVSALSRAIDGGAWFKTATCGGSATTTGNVSGEIDFARSSAKASSFPPGNTLTFLPFARDGVSYAYFDHGSNELANLTVAQLQSLYGTNNTPNPTGTITLANTHTVAACMVQAGSGTGKFWDGAMGNSPANGATSHQSAVNSGCNATVDYEENGANSWVTSAFIAALPATEDAVIPFSAGSWIAQLNQAAQDRSSAACNNTASTTQGGAVGLGGPLGAATPPRTTTGCGTGQAANPTYYADGTFGRDLFVVVPTIKLGVPGDPGLKSLFLGSTSAICSQATTIQLFGFSTATVSGTCGQLVTGTNQSGLNP
jgi:hypothetical protein